MLYGLDELCDGYSYLWIYEVLASAKCRNTWQDLHRLLGAYTCRNHHGPGKWCLFSSIAALLIFLLITSAGCFNALCGRHGGGKYGCCSVSIGSTCRILEGRRDRVTLAWQHSKADVFIFAFRRNLILKTH